MSNDYDAKIIAALNGETVTETVTEAAENDAIHRALTGQPSMAEEAVNRSIARHLGDSNATIMGVGIPQSDDYLAQLGMEAAKGALRDRLMKADPKLTAGAAEMRVDVAAEAAYVAAERHRYEADRLASVTETLKAQAPAAAVREATPKAATTTKPVTVIFEGSSRGPRKRIQ
jgi:hypothetical protein